MTDVTITEDGDTVVVTTSAPEIIEIVGIGPQGPQGGGANNLDELTDVSLASVASGNLLRYDGSTWVNYPGSNYASVGTTNTFGANQIISVTDNTNAALRVTQLGTGEAIRVEDSTNPDATPFVVTAAGDVGIGTASPAVKLDVVGNAKISGDAAIGTGANGTAPSLVINGGTDGSNGPVIFGQGNGNNEWLISSGRSIVGSGAAGLYDYVYGNNPRVFYTNGSERMRIDGSGNVGIGTSSPSVKLDVAGNIDATSGGTFRKTANITSGAGLILGTVSKGTAPGGTQGVIGIYSDDAAAVQLQGTISLVTSAAASERRLRIGAVEQNVAFRNITLAELGGNVGIGASAPGATGFTSFLALGNNNAGIGNAGTNIIGIVTNNAERMRINDVGNVGIGTSSPSTRLDVVGSAKISGDTVIGTGANGTAPILAINGGTDGNNGPVIFGRGNSNNEWIICSGRSIVGGGAAGLYDYVYGNNPRAFYTNNAERMRIDGSGNVLVTSTGGLGYGTGSGGAVTQATSRTTGVTLNKTNGAITLVSAAGSATWQSFTVTNSTVAATDTVIVSQKSGTDLYQAFVTNVAAGSFRISFATTGGTTTEQPVFNFSVIKAVTS